MGLRAALLVELACVPEIKERCRLLTAPTPPPALPHDFAELDALLLGRVTDMARASRDLNRSIVIVFHKDFAEVLLPDLCQRLEQARALAVAGQTVEAGRKYQSLLVASQVLAYAVAVQSMAQYADVRAMAGGQISRTQEKFAAEATPILVAALSEDPRQIERALTAHPEVFAGWGKLLEQWPARIDDGTHRVEVAKVVWDIAFLVAAVYEAAGAAADLAVTGRPPVPPFPVLAVGGGAATAGVGGAATLELAEVVRRLVATGALDAGVVAALSTTLGARAAPSAPSLPTAVHMSGAGRGGTRTTDQGRVMNELGLTKREFNRGIHDIKSKIEGNPDMEFDLETGEVYDRRSGEPVGNILDYKGTDAVQRGGP